MVKKDISKISNYVLDFIKSNNDKKNVIDLWNSDKNQKKFNKSINNKEIKFKEDRPKRSKTKYIIFCEEYRNKIKTENPGLSNNDIICKMGKMWL